MSSEQLPKAEGDPARLTAVEHGLAGVNPRSLDALMAEDVMKLSELEFKQVIEELRRQRAVWAANDAAKADSQGKAPRGKAAPKAKGAGSVSISMEELFGDD